MSAYGTIVGPKSTTKLEPLVYPIKRGSVSTHPISAAEAPKELVDYLYKVFAQEVEDGKTYPQEGVYSRDDFLTYFFVTASTTVVGILHDEVLATPPATLEEAAHGRKWEDCVGGCFYIKPNYPGRSSHNCNGGFIVPPNTRGRSVGNGLAQAFCVYVPKLGFRASVFNLVYANNGASIRLWEKYGFTKVGTIPQAGRLKTGPNGTEEYVDAHIIWKSFV